MMPNTSERILWIDLIKVMGIYLIVLGHFFPIGYKYIYAISVPLFFFISGYLSKRTSLKIFHNLLIPCILLSICSKIVELLIDICNNEYISLNNLGKWVIAVLIGNQGEIYIYGGLGGMWFIYTLMLIKFLFWLLKSNKNYIIAIVIMMILSVFLNLKGLLFYSSWVNVLLAFPYFIIGFWVKEYMLLEKIKVSNWGILTVGFMFFLTSSFNGCLMMYRNDYGGNIFLSYVSSLLGILFCYMLCKKYVIFIAKLNSPIIDNLYIRVISVGTIIILAFHGYIIAFLRYIDIFYFDLYLSITSYIYSVIILFLFYPIIVFCQKYIPVILGRRTFL